MSLAAALIYWLIIALWLAVLAAVGAAFIRNPRTFGTTRLLLMVLLIDTVRNVLENLYFGLYWGGQYGLFPASIVGVLGNPYLLVLPKAVNVLARDNSLNHSRPVTDLQKTEFPTRPLVIKPAFDRNFRADRARDQNQPTG